MSASLVSIIVLAFAAGFATPYVLHWIDWQRGKNRRPDWTDASSRLARRLGEKP